MLVRYDLRGAVLPSSITGIRKELCSSSDSRSYVAMTRPATSLGWRAGRLGAPPVAGPLGRQRPAPSLRLDKVVHK